MKYYKLLRDLPTFNAGDKFVLKDDGLYLAEETPAYREDEMMAYRRDTLDRFNILKDWFEPTSEPGPWEPIAITTSECGLEVSLVDYYEIDTDGEKKTEFTWDEAMEIPEKVGNGWRLPTMIEWTKLCIEFGAEGGVYNAQRFCDNLNIVEDCGNWWSSSVASATNSRNLYLRLDNHNSPYYLYPQLSNGKGYAFAVRLVRDGSLDTSRGKD